MTLKIKKPLWAILLVLPIFILTAEASIAQDLPQPPQPTPFDEAGFKEGFDRAMAHFQAKRFAEAEGVLKKLVIAIAREPGREKEKGATFLLMGATCEGLKNKSEAFRYFCLAKQLLGKGNSIEGVDLAKFKQYKKECPLSGVYKK